MKGEIITHYIRIQTYGTDGQLIPWEEIPATSVKCTSAQIILYAMLRSQETGCKVRINKEGSLNGTYYGGTMARDTHKVMSTAFPATKQPTEDGN